MKYKQIKKVGWKVFLEKPSTQIIFYLLIKRLKNLEKKQHKNPGFYSDT